MHWLKGFAATALIKRTVAVLKARAGLNRTSWRKDMQLFVPQSQLAACKSCLL